MKMGSDWQSVKSAKLDRLVETLDDVLTIFRLDPDCPWIADFEEFIRVARELRDRGFTWDELKGYSRSVCDRMLKLPAYNLPTSLPAEGLHGTNNLETFWRAAFRQADDLRAVHEPIHEVPTTKDLGAAEGPTRPRIMYIERKAGELTGNARIGRVRFSKSGKSIYYDGKRFETLGGRGFKANYFEVESGEEYWISGCKKDGSDRLYGERIPVVIDEDVREEYWTEIRMHPECKDRTIANM